jgi:hypothetical protein
VNRESSSRAGSTNILIACAGAAVGTLILAVVVVSVFFDPASASLFFEWYAPIVFLGVAAMWYPILSKLLHNKGR